MRRPDGYPTSALAHGPTLLLDGYDLAEEGVGFGVPVAMRGPTAVFPEDAESPTTGAPPRSAGEGSPQAARLEGSAARSTAATYRLALGERVVLARGSPPQAEPRRGFAGPRLLDRAHEGLARLHRDHAGLRPVVDAGGDALRRVLGMTTRYEPIHPAGLVHVTYEYPVADVLTVIVDPLGITDPTVTTLAVMNEVGATLFTDYRDSDRLQLAGAQIESWAEVRAEWAALAAPTLGVELVVEATPGARLFRGRELAHGRLAWAGFGYLLAPPWRPFSYRLCLRPSSPPATETRRPAGRMPVWSHP